ncbi:hypothetical protein Q5424_09280 [Conexibacter sp. JD483]|uniref:hypothetical protein n=1 Tax=unclassified Conexibacter TaxID=2627773 RepID=UPI00271FA04E|nr:MULTISPECIES: hypothetical protein [unclassified Conexibacter]MDO8187232.1 hypothetical protein [Conexibacter sp. CPCC 205706]MDO8199329.1 hypothetical protein [Conexibacter sp. CPCC 205762]MDR9369270.1 hypothetical protein [Conexibacter sp. JD483]
MTSREWQLIAVVLENCWKGEWDEARAAAYFVLLKPFAAADVERALHVLVRNGSPFIPAVAEIVTTIEEAERVGVPTWPEAFRQLRRLLPRHSRDHEAGFAALAAVHPLLASFVAAYGWRRLAHEPVEDPDYGGAVLRRLERSWQEHVERQQTRASHELAFATVERRRLAGPRKLDAASLLPAPPERLPLPPEQAA